MNLRRLLLLFIFGIGVFSRSSVHGEVCFSCKTNLTQGFWMEDQVEFVKRPFCPACTRLTTICFICGLPTKTNFTRLKDDRLVCARDARDIVFDEDQAKGICESVRPELDTLFWRFTKYPTNSSIEIIDRAHIETLFKTAGRDSACGSIYGITIPGAFQSRRSYAIKVLGAMNRESLRSTAAHEFTHTWVQEFVPKERKLHRYSEEGFCELMAYKLMENDQCELQKTLIVRNNYTRGQAQALIAADAAYGFYMVLEWIKAGEDEMLDEKNPDRIRQVRRPQSTPSAAGSLSVPTPAAPPALVVLPTELTLKGIIATKITRFALINDQMLAPGDEALVKLAGGEVRVHCDEVGETHAVVTVDHAPTGTRLELKKVN